MKFSAIFCGQKAEQMQPSSPDFSVVVPFFAINLAPLTSFYWILQNNVFQIWSVLAGYEQ